MRSNKYRSDGITWTKGNLFSGCVTVCVEMADTIAESDRHLSWDVGPIRGTWKNRGSLYPHWNFGVHGRGVACVSYLNIDEDAHNTARIVFPYLPFPSPPPLFHLLIYTSAIFAISSIVLSSLPPPLRYNDISPSTGTQVEYYHYTCRYPRTRVPVFTLNIYIYITREQYRCCLEWYRGQLLQIPPPQ